MTSTPIKNFRVSPETSDDNLVNRYAHEIVRISMRYPSGWTCASVAEQAERLNTEFPKLRLDDAKKDAAKMVCPAAADGLGILLKIRALGRIFDIKYPYDSGYSDVGRYMLTENQQNHPDILLRYEVHKGNFIHIYPKVKEKLMNLEAFDDKDYMILPINFGDPRNGFLCSPRNVRQDALVNKNRLPLGVVQVSGLLRANPDRLTDYDHLFMSCPADRYNRDFDNRWTYCPCFGISEKDNRLVFYPQKESDACDGTGAVVAYP